MMTNSEPNTDSAKSNSLAGGFFVAAGMLGGAIAGIYFDQPSIGMVSGLGFGILVAIAIWVIDRKRK
jgi:hypothetical protein